MFKSTCFFLFFFLFSSIANSQVIDHTFKNKEIEKYLHDNPQESPFNNTICMIGEAEYPCFDNYGAIRIENVNDSTERLYYKNGKMACEIFRKKNSRLSRDFFYNTDNVFCIQEYRKDKFWNITFYDKETREIPNKAFKNGTGKLKYYRQNGSISAVLNYINGELEGNFILYYSNGNIMLKGFYKNGGEIGDGQEFMPKK